MGVFCHNCHVSLQWDYSLEAQAHRNGHFVYCSKCARQYRQGKLKKGEKYYD